MGLVRHVLICRRLRVELPAAGFAADFGRPMFQHIHVLTGRVRGAELLGAHLRVEEWCPVTGVVHVLIAGWLTGC